MAIFIAVAASVCPRFGPLLRLHGGGLDPSSDVGKRMRRFFDLLFDRPPARPTQATTVADERVTHGCAVLCVEGFSNCEKDNSKLMLGVSKYAFMLVMIPINASEQLTVAGVFICPCLMYIWSSDQGCKKLIYIV